MTTLVVETSEGIQIRLDLAGAGSRYAAALLDAIILGIGSMLFLFALMLIASVDASGLGGFLLGIYAGGLILIALAYHVAFHVFDRGSTPGKRILGIRVVSSDGQPATTFQIVLRALIQLIDVLLFVPVSIGLVVIAAGPRCQRLGDLAAGTLVVRPSVPPYVEDPFPRETWSAMPLKTLPLTPALVLRLSPDERAFLRALVTRKGLISNVKRELFVKAAQNYSEKMGLGPFADARDVLKELYLFLREFPPQQTS